MPRPMRTPPRSQVNAGLRRYAERAMYTSSADSAYLCSRPLAGCEFVSYAPSITPVVLSGIFNPLGPTLQTVFLAGVPKLDVVLLANAFVNPFGSDSIVYGAMPVQASGDAEQLMQVVEQLFRSNGSERYPLWKSLPEYVMPVLHPDLPNALAFLKECFYQATRILEPQDLDRMSRQIREARGNPWSRTPVEDLRRLLDPSATETEVVAWPPSHESFERWWDTVTDPDGWEVDFPHIQVAWNGAITFQADMGNMAKANSAMSWEEAADFVRRILRTPSTPT